MSDPTCQPDAPTCDISVIVLTADRPLALRRLVAALEHQTPAPREFVYVDNGAEGVFLKPGRTMTVRRIAGGPEMSFAEARNLAVRNAVGEWVACIDDDCVPAPDWLSRIATWTRQCHAVGGPVIAWDSLPAPPWFDPEMGWAAGLSTPGVFTTEAGRSILPQTANLAVRRSLLLDNPFQEGSPVAFGEAETRRYLSGREDAELWTRLRILGYRAQFDPGLVVFHDIPPARIDRTYLRARMTQDARASVMRSSPPRFVQQALDERADALIPWPRPLARRMWLTRQREFLRQCRRQGEPQLQGRRYWERLFQSWTAQVAARTRQLTRSLIAPPRTGRPVPPPEAIRKCVIAARGCIGDMVLLAPVLAHLSRQLANRVQIILLTGKRTRELYADLPVADRIRTLDVAVAEADIDLVLVPYWHGHSAASLFRLGAPVVTYDRDVGFSRRLWHDLADQTIVKDFAVHETLNLCRLFAPLGVEGPPAPIAWPRPPEAVEKTDRLLSEMQLPPDVPLVGIHPAATHAEKRWPLERWTELLGLLEKRYPDHRFVVVGAAENRDRMDAWLRANGLKARNLCGRDDLQVFAELARRMRLLISTDAGPRHLAAAVGCPTVGIYGWTGPERWGAFFEPEKHAALAVGDAIMTDEERHQRPGLAIRRVTVGMAYEACVAALDRSGA